jgi:hypothetical protein
MNVRSELVKGAFTETLSLLGTEWKKIYFGIFKIELVSWIIAIIGMAIGIGAYLLLESLPFLLRIALSAIVSLPVLLASSMVTYLAYNLIDSLWSKKRLGFGEVFRENALPLVGYMAVNALIRILIIGPIIVIMFFFFVASAATELSGILDLLVELVFRVLLFVIGSAIELFTQFAIFELLIARSGVLGSFGKGYSITRKSIIETFLFSFVLSVAGGFLSAPFIIILAMIVIFGIFGAIALSGIAGIAAMALMCMLCFILIVAMHAAISTLTIPAQYRYWSKARLI